MIEQGPRSTSCPRQHADRGVLTQLNSSSGGMPKRAILAAFVTANGVPGDWQHDRKHHGGPVRAICLFSEELYAWLRDDYGIDLANGSVGENFTTRGIDLDQLGPGDRLRAGDCTIEITDVRIPCRNLTQWHKDLHRIIQGRSGWVAKVVEPGDVKPGDEVELLPKAPEPK